MKSAKIVCSATLSLLYLILIIKPSFGRHRNYEPNPYGGATAGEISSRRTAGSAVLKSTTVTEYPNVDIDDGDGSSPPLIIRTDSTAAAVSPDAAGGVVRQRQRKIATAVMAAVGVLVLITTLGVMVLIFIVVRRSCGGHDKSLDEDDDDDRAKNGDKQRRRVSKNDDGRRDRKNYSNECSPRSSTRDKSSISSDKK